jgi:glycosyltransferase involved in cell wall biosynthesis
MKQKLKSWIFGLWGKDPDPVVVTFGSGPAELVRRMWDEVRELMPERRHFLVTIEGPDGPGVIRLTPGDAGEIVRQLEDWLRPWRIGMAPVLLTEAPIYEGLRRAAFRLARGKVLAYNERLERLHLRWSNGLASYLFWRGVALDRVRLRPSWLVPWKRDRTRRIDSHREIEGRAAVAGRPRVGILTPYSPYPLSHGGAVRMFNLLREVSGEFDLYLFVFGEIEGQDLDVLRGLFVRIWVFPQPYFREPGWSTWRPPEVCEFGSDYVLSVVNEARDKHGIQIVQAEYTQLASYAADILVEHDVTFDLYEQIARREPSLRNRWNAWRWRRYELRAVRRFRRVVAMSEKDRGLVGATDVIPNGVDLCRFEPMGDSGEAVVLFVGSFRHFPNVAAYRWFYEEVWAQVRAKVLGVRFVVVAGPDGKRYASWGEEDASLEVYEVVADVRPLYARARVVVVPTVVSAGTNLKVVEAMACARAVVSTRSGVGGLDLGSEVVVADTAAAFAEEVVSLLQDGERRQTLGRAARREAERRFGWRELGRRQAGLWRELLSGE